MKHFKSIIYRIKKIINVVKNEHIGAFAAQSSFFFIVSVFPLVFLIISMLSVSQKGTELFLSIVSSVIPYSDRNTFELIINRFVVNSKSILSVTFLFAAWSAGRGFYALTEGFNSLLVITEKRNYLTLRLRSLVFSVVFSIITAIIFIVGVYGKILQNMILSEIKNCYTNQYMFSFIRILFVIIVLFVMLLLLYLFLPDWKTYAENGAKRFKLKIFMFCSMISSIFIYIYTVIFSFVSQKIYMYDNFYGGVNAFLAIMLWIYVTMYIIVLGFRASLYLNSAVNKKPS